MSYRPRGEQEQLVSRRSSLTKRLSAGAPRPDRCCTGWGGGAPLRSSVGQDANTRCSGCSMCVASSKTWSRPINMRLVAHVAGKRPFFVEGELMGCRSRPAKDANARCSGCSTCVTSPKARSRPINMRLVAHVAGKRLFARSRVTSPRVTSPRVTSPVLHL
jgi:hypothetical protein